jgi:hypothetical protein
LDTLILSPYFLLIIEVKNITGTVYFDETFNQLIRTNNGKEEAFPDPILQVQRQQSQLRDFLQTNKFPHIPIEALIVFSSPYTLIKTSATSKNRISKVIHSAELPFKNEHFRTKYKVERYSTKEIRRLSSLLLKKHTPSTDDLLHQFDIAKHDLLKGVHCPSCFSIPMSRKHGKWECPFCSTISKQAHIESLSDYTLLISQTITNRQLRDFLLLPSKSSSLHLLNSLELDYYGTTRDRTYILKRNQ